MTAAKWSRRSLDNLKGVHLDLRKICHLALINLTSNHSDLDFVIIDGMRTYQEQLKHYETGASKTMDSRHLYGYAIDFMMLVNGKGRWEASYYKIAAPFFKSASRELEVPITWGGDWKWKDWGHIELDRKAYPNPKK